MARGEYIEMTLDGPLFDGKASRRFYDAVAEGIEELSELGADILTQFVAKANFIDTGDFIDSIGNDMHRERGAGYGTIRPDNVWPKPGRPTRTWFERGTRGGVKMRKANTGFSRTRTRLRQESVGFIADKIERALN